MAPIKVSKPSRSKASKAIVKSKPAKQQNPNMQGKGKANAKSSSKAISAPVALGFRTEFRNSQLKTTHRVKNSELIGSVANSVSFATTRYDVNPGLSRTFPWLSVEAAQWEQYVFHNLRFRYVPRCATSTVGSLILSPDYAVKDLAPTTEVQASNTQDASEGPDWAENFCLLDRQSMFPLGPRKLIRSGEIGSDQNVYDAASLYVSTVDGADTNVIGKLWVDYDVEFFVPQSSPSDISGPSKMSLFYNAADESYTSAVQKTQLWDTTVYDPLKLSPASGVFTPKAGVYLFEAILTFSDSAAEAFAVDFFFYVDSQNVTGSHSAISGSESGDCLPMSWIVPCTGTTTVAIRGTVTGAAGNLKTIGGYCQLRVSVV